MISETQRSASTSANDPRLAALAEALEAAIERWAIDCEGPNGWRPFGPEYAAAILAALPPDWCGHDPDWPPVYGGPAKIEVEILNGISAAEIARLRKIEEAAQALLRDAFLGNDFMARNGLAMDAPPRVRRAVRALRAALEAER